MSGKLIRLSLIVACAMSAFSCKPVDSAGSEEQSTWQKPSGTVWCGPVGLKAYLGARKGFAREQRAQDLAFVTSGAYIASAGSKICELSKPRSVTSFYECDKAKLYDCFVSGGAGAACANPGGKACGQTTQTTEAQDALVNFKQKDQELLQQQAQQREQEAQERAQLNQLASPWQGKREICDRTGLTACLRTKNSNDARTRQGSFTECARTHCNRATGFSSCDLGTVAVTFIVHGGGGASADKGCVTNANGYGN